MGITTLYFRCTHAEFEEKAPAWIFPAPNLDEPRRVEAKNPFTGETLSYLDFRAPEQPDAPDDSPEPDIWDLPSFSHRFLDESQLGELVQLVDGRDAKTISGRISGQLFLHGGEAEHEIMLVA